MESYVSNYNRNMCCVCSVAPVSRDQLYNYFLCLFGTLGLGYPTLGTQFVLQPQIL